MPVATYRLQLQPGFGFARAQATLPYLQQLGVSHLYLSPIWKPRPGSTHGYDVVDPRQLNPELGSREAFAALAADCHARGMALVLDIVPNHLAASELNPWWRDLLVNGRGSRFAHYFDIDWQRGEGKLILPLLGSDPGEAIAGGDLRLERGVDGQPTLRYFEHALPLADGSAGEHTPGAEPVADILGRQHYRLVHWREAAARVNYRRFFDINHLAALRAEDEEVFGASHALIGELVARDGVAGVRVDHVDGIRDPQRYLQQLRAMVGDDRFIWVEKILGEDEEIPSDWPVDGTTGYEVQGLVDQVLVERRGLQRLDLVHQRLVGPRPPFAQVVFESKLEMIATLFPGELEALAAMLEAVAGDERPRHRPDEWALGLAEFTAGLPCYRTYITPRGASEQDLRMLASALDVARQYGSGAETLERVAAAIESAHQGPAIEFVQRWQQFSGPVAAKGLEDTALYRDRLLLSLDAVGRPPSEEPPITSAGQFHRAMAVRAGRFPAGLSASSTHDSKRHEDVRHRISVLAQFPAEWARSVARWRKWNRPLVQTVGGQAVPDASTEWAFYQTLIGTWPGAAACGPEYIERLQRYITKAEREAALRTSWRDPDEAYERALAAFVADSLGDDASPFVRSLEALANRVAWHAALHSLSATVLKIVAPGVPDFFQGTETGALRLVDPDNRGIVEFQPLGDALESLAERPAGAWWRDALPGGHAKLRVIRDGLRARRSFAEAFEGAYEPLAVEGERATHLVAFARSSGREHVVAVVPRLTAALCRRGQLPVGPATWGDAVVVLPPGFPASYREAIGAGPDVTAEAGRLRVARILANAPVALLVAEA